jgi:hypothetical protein
VTFDPVRFEALEVYKGHVEDVDEETIWVVMHPQVREKHSICAELIREKMISDDEISPGTCFTLEIGYEFDRFGTRRRGTKFTIEKKTWTKEEIHQIKLEAKELVEKLGWSQSSE